MTLEIQLEGPHRPRPHRQRSAWPLVLAVLALFAAGLVARKAAPSSGKGHRCADNADCPSMVCSAGRCR